MRSNVLTCPQARGSCSYHCRVMGAKPCKCLLVPRRIALSGFALHEKIGVGSYAQVRTCTQLSTGATFAVKIVHLHRKQKVVWDFWRTGSAMSVQALGYRAIAVMEEILWKDCSGHCNIVKLYETFIMKHFAFYVMELCDYSLLDLLVDGPEVYEEDLEQCFCQMLQAIEHIHSKDIIHRDIKPANFLIKDGNIKLCDFGLAVKRDTLAKYVVPPIVGTRPFMAPEMLKMEQYSCTVDVWSTGVTIYVILFGAFPYNAAERDPNGAPAHTLSDRQSLANAIRTNTPPPRYEAAAMPGPSQATIAFVKELLQHDASLRKTATECLMLDPVRDYCRPKIFTQKSVSFTSLPSDDDSSPARQHSASRPSMIRAASSRSVLSSRTAISSIAPSVASSGPSSAASSLSGSHQGDDRSRYDSNQSAHSRHSHKSRLSTGSKTDSSSGTGSHPRRRIMSQRTAMWEAHQDSITQHSIDDAVEVIRTEKNKKKRKRAKKGEGYSPDDDSVMSPAPSSVPSKGSGSSVTHSRLPKSISPEFQLHATGGAIPVYSSHSTSESSGGHHQDASRLSSDEAKATDGVITSRWIQEGSGGSKGSAPPKGKRALEMVTEALSWQSKNSGPLVQDEHSREFVASMLQFQHVEQDDTSVAFEGLRPDSSSVQPPCRTRPFFGSGARPAASRSQR